VILQSTLTNFDVEPSEDVHLIDDVPYNWLIPRTAAAVHHASAGMAHEAARAGKVSVSVPVYADHFFWARRLHEAKLGTEPLPIRRVTAERLIERLRGAMSPSARGRAGEVSRGLAAEDGVGSALNQVEAEMARP
jgi:sterol 3beta-glucosyltransferase